ncbi:MAG: hypothetical protein ABSA12_14800 [Verrucomicrobiia bacterium]
MNDLPSNWKEMIRRCSFFTARRVIADILHVGTQQAAARGEVVTWKKEIGDAWNLFAENPCYETAVGFVAVEPTCFKYFSGCCPGGALHKTGSLTVMDFYVGCYSLETNIADLHILSELSSQEYEFFPRVFKGEVIYHAVPVELLGRKWEFMVSLVNGRIIKWAASLELRENEVAEMVQSTFQHCEWSLGSPTEEKQGWFFWDKSDGNVILQVAQLADVFDISIFATSREIRKL